MSEMADSQPPEGLLTAVTKIVSEKWGPCEDDVCEADRSGIGTDCTAARATVADMLAALFEACEVREEHRIVIDDERASGLPVNGLWTTPPVMVDTHHFLLGRYPSARVERRFVIETAPEPVSSTGEETDRG